MKTIEISAEYFKLIKSFLPSFKRAEGITSNKYLIDWNELMPVVEKINNHVYDSQEDENWIEGKFTIHHRAYPITFGMISQEGKPMFRFNRQSLFAYDTLIESCYHACVEFIKWYNSQNKDT